MKASTWTLLAVGVGAWWWLRRDADPLSFLGSPLEGGGPLVVTPHGQYGAPRAGPHAHAHQGNDLAAPPGARILAVGDGVIIAARPGLGRLVRKLHLDRPASWPGGHRAVDSVVYADLGRALVEPGDRVRAGDPVALVGDRGFFHFAVKQHDSFFDPATAGLSTHPTDAPARVVVA